MILELDKYQDYDDYYQEYFFLIEKYLRELINIKVNGNYN